MKTIKSYKLNNGSKPFDNWLQSLDKNLKKRVLNKLIQLKNENYSNCSILKQTGGVKEARIKTTSGLRIYFAEENNEIIILLAGGDKDTQEKDIENAKEYLEDYKQRRQKSL
ncbi:MAG: type II toxin-antitoxin system RelE/ParE family toxin [Cyanobacteriota bacterium]